MGKIFITGVAGFLGSSLAENLLERNHEVFGCDNLLGGKLSNIPKDVNYFQVDCNDLDRMKEITKGMDTLVHTACTGYEGFSVFSPNFIVYNTFQASSSVFTACAANSIPKVINCSSMARYGKQQNLPFTEKASPKPVDPYGIAKLASENLLKVLAEVHNFNYVNLVPHNIIGPKQKFDDPYRNVASIFINLMLQNKQPIIYGDGEQLRCFSDIRDVLPSFIKAIETDLANGLTINIGPDEEFITINDLAKMIATKLCFSNLAPRYFPNRPQEVKESVCSSDLARSILDYKTRYSLEESIQYLIDSIVKAGPKKFNYNFLIEIENNKCPTPWTKKCFND